VVYVLEAMKMENDVAANTSGAVVAVPIESSASVDVGNAYLLSDSVGLQLSIYIS